MKDKKTITVPDKKDLVQYSNEFALSINSYSAYELDLVLTLAYVARKIVKDHKKIPTDKDLELNLPASFIKKTLQGNTSGRRMKQSLLNVFNMNVFLRQDNFTKVKHLFEELNFNDDYSIVKFILKKEYIHLFFNLTGSFTQHEILEFTNLKGKYTKKIYQIIMAYKILGEKEYPVDVFRKLLDIPEKYRWTNIDKKIINPAIEELKNTNIEKFELEKTKEGKEITKVTFKWKLRTPEIIKDEEKPKKKKIDVKKEEVEEVKFVEPTELTPEEEEKGIEKLLADGLDKSYIATMKKNSKTMYINMIRNVLKGVE